MVSNTGFENRAGAALERTMRLRELRNDIRRYERLVSAAELDLKIYKIHLIAAQQEFEKFTKEKDDE